MISLIGFYYWYTDIRPLQGGPSLTDLASPKKQTITVNNRGTFTVDIADTDATRSRGLSGREPLKSDQGMLFKFDTLDRYGIWMKQMNFSIDIVWFDTNGKIIWIESDVPPDSYPHIFIPPSPAKYVLELNSGIAARRGFVIGDQLEFLDSLH
jgi:uncharacterized protein